MRRGSQFKFTKLDRISKEVSSEKRRERRASLPVVQRVEPQVNAEVKAIAEIMGEELLMRDKELLYGLTKGQNFDSNYNQLKELRENKQVR